jgi:hypothetical protein
MKLLLVRQLHVYIILGASTLFTRLLEDASLGQSALILFLNFIQECGKQKRGKPGVGIIGELIGHMASSKENIPLLQNMSYVINALLCKWFAYF